VNVALKHLWLSGTWLKPIALQRKVLRDVSVGRKEFKPPEWEGFTS
jgi:hypothetical protein